MNTIFYQQNSCTSSQFSTVSLLHSLSASELIQSLPIAFHQQIFANFLSNTYLFDTMSKLKQAILSGFS
jgi:hypothetical protein